MKVRALIEALEAIAAERGDDFPVYVPDQTCGCCNYGPGPVDVPEVVPASTAYNETRPECVYLTQNYEAK